MKPEELMLRKLHASIDGYSDGLEMDYHTEVVEKSFVLAMLKDLRKLVVVIRKTESWASPSEARQYRKAFNSKLQAYLKENLSNEIHPYKMRKVWDEIKTISDEVIKEVES